MKRISTITAMLVMAAVNYYPGHSRPLSDLPGKLMEDNVSANYASGQKAEKIKINGKITDEKGNPIPHVTVTERGTKNATMSGEDGNFAIDVSTADAVLVFSSVGYISQEAKASNNMTIALLPENKDLEQVVVVGYGTQKKINLSGAVQSVTSKALENRPVTNLGASLEGLIPNLNITTSNGRANTNASFNIRGYTSLNGGDPFILVDNIPMTPAEVSLLNPSDIENVTVLKDAAASAIYGARAAFGVILITTKTAKTRDLLISIDGNIAIRNLGAVPEVVTDPLTTMQYKHDAAYPLYNLYPQQDLDYAKQMQTDPNLPNVIVNPTDPTKWSYYGTTNWLDEAYKKTAPSYTANINISKKDDKLSYMLSGGFYEQDGLLRYGNDIYKRYNLRANTSYTFNKRLKVGVNSSYINSNYDSPNYLDGNFFWNVNRQPSLYTVYNPDGTYTSSGANIIGGIKDGGRTKNNLDDITTTLFADVAILDGWNLKADLNFRRTNSVTTVANFAVPYREGPDQPLKYVGPQGATSFARNEEASTRYNVFNIYSDYHKTFKEKHYLQVLVGYNQEYRYINSFWVRRDNLISTALPSPQLATGTITQDNDISDWAVQGIFGRLNYIFDNKYIVEFNGRYDGTSRFPKGDRWGFFPSASVSWVLSKEKFFEPVADAVRMNLFKLRASYGSLGNQNVTDANGNQLYYPYIPSMSTGVIGQVLDGSRPLAVYQPGTVSPTLTWEKVNSVNVGADMTFLKNRLDISFDWYTRYTIGMLTKSRTMPAVFGAKEPKTNAADLKTKGWELSVGWRDKVEVKGSPLNYSVRLSLADSRAYITKYDNPAKLLSDHYKGEEIGEIWGFYNDGFFQTQDEIDALDQREVGSDDMSYKFYVGDLKFKDLDKDHKITYGDNTVDNPGDRRIIGNNRIRMPYSIDLNAGWKGFDLRLFFQGVGKRDWYPNPSNIYFWGVYAQPWTNVTKQNMDHWTPENPNGYYPRVKAYIAEDNSELGMPQTKYLQNAAYLRLKNITIGYTLPTSLMEKLKISKTRVYFSAENVFTIDHLMAGMDPEGLDGSVYPFQKTFSFGLNLIF